MVSTGLAKLGYEYINVGAGPSSRPLLRLGVVDVCLSHAAVVSRCGRRRLPDARARQQWQAGGGLGALPLRHAQVGRPRPLPRPQARRLCVPHLPCLLLRPEQGELHERVADTDLTNRSCGRGPGSFGHYTIDAQTIAHDWDADYLKVRPHPLLPKECLRSLLSVVLAECHHPAASTLTRAAGRLTTAATPSRATPTRSTPASPRCATPSTPPARPSTTRSARIPRLRRSAPACRITGRQCIRRRQNGRRSSATPWPTRCWWSTRTALTCGTRTRRQAATAARCPSRERHQSRPVGSKS